MRTFIEQLKGSLWKERYLSPESNLAGKAITYLVMLALVLGIIKAAIVGATVIPLIGELKEYVFSVIDEYPEDLVLKWRDGKLSMNQPSPFVAEMKDDSIESEFANMLVIDTEAKLDLATFESYDTAILATAEGFMVAEDGGVKADSFKDFPDYTLTKQVVDSHKAKVSTLFGNFEIIAYIALMLFLWMMLSIGTFVGGLFWGLVGVLLVLLIAHAKGRKLAFTNLYATSLYAIGIVLLIGTFEYLVRLPSLISFVAFLVILLQIPKKEPEAPAAPLSA